MREFFRCWVLTLLGYSAQGACKFGFYEFFKKYYSDLVSPENAAKYKTFIFLAGSTSAEVIADIALCPIEAVKVRVQAQPGFARGLSDGLPKFIKAEGAGELYKGLVLLWDRQIPSIMPKSRDSYSPNHENCIGDGGAIKSFNVILSPHSSPNSACDDTTTTISDPHYPLTINGSNNSEPMSEINQLNLNQKLKGKKTIGYAKEMLKTHKVEHACPMKESLIWTQQNLKRYDQDFLFKTVYGSSGYDKIFEKVVLKPQGGVGRGIRIVNHNDNSNNEPIRNNINEQHHHHDNPDNNNRKKVIDDVIVNDGEDGRIQSLPYKKNRPYTYSKCMAVFETSQKFVAHICSHYKHESKAERMKRQMAKMMRRSKKGTILEHQQQHIKNFGGGGGGSALQVNMEDQAHHNNNYDAPPGFDVHLSVGKIKIEPFP
ncbi:hypothetical protein HN51_020035 [Arachis hypogaea]